MQLRFIIVATACLCLVVPPTYSTPILTAKAIAAAKLKAAAAAVGAGVVAKGAAVVATKGALLKGAASLIAKGLAAKGAAIKGAIAAKAALIDQTAKAVHAGAALTSKKIDAINSLVDKPQEAVVYYEPYYYPPGYELVVNNFQPVPAVPQPEVYYSVPIIEKDC